MFRVALVGLWLTLSACSGGGSSIDDTPTGAGVVGTAAIEVINASADAPDLTMIMNDDNLVAGLAFKEAGFVQVDSQVLDLQLQGMMVQGAVNVSDPLEISAAADDRVSIIAADVFDQLQTIVLVEPRAEVDSNQVRLRWVHAATNTAMVDILVGDAAASLNDLAPVATLGFTEAAEAMLWSEGESRIWITLAGDPEQVLFDTGVVSLTGGSDLVVSLVQNTGAGPAPVVMLASTGNDYFVLRDQATEAEVRVVHASAQIDQIAWQLSSDSQTVAATATTSGEDSETSADDERVGTESLLTFGQATPYERVVSGTNTFGVRPARSEQRQESLASFALGGSYSAIVFNTADALKTLVLADDRRAVASMGKLRWVHTATLAGVVDIELQPVDSDVTASVVNRLSLAEASDYLVLVPGDYEVVVKRIEDGMPVMDPILVNVATRSVATALLLDGADLTTPLAIIALDELAASEQDHADEAD